MSPSMDIQISRISRLLYEASDRDAGEVVRYMGGLKQSGAFDIEKKDAQGDPQDLQGDARLRIPGEETIKTVLAETGYSPIAHGCCNSRGKAQSKGGCADDRLSTAHRPSSRRHEKGSGIDRRFHRGLLGLMDREERFDVLQSDLMPSRPISAQARVAGNCTPGSVLMKVECTKLPSGDGRYRTHAASRKRGARRMGKIRFPQ